jgi:hypothetical protein
MYDNSRMYVKNLSTRKVTKRTFNTEDPEILVDWKFSRPGDMAPGIFTHPIYNIQKVDE